MFYLTERDYATLFLDGATLFLIILIISGTAFMRKRNRADDRLFFVMMLLNCVIAISDTIGYIFDMKELPGSRALCITGMTVFYCAFVLIAMVWLRYTAVKLTAPVQPAGRRLRPAFIPGIVMVVLIILNIFTGWIFAYDDTGAYQRGILFIPMYIVIAIYLIAGFVIVTKRTKDTSDRTVIPVWIYVLPIIFGIIFTFIVPENASFAPIGIAISILFTHMGTVGQV